ncbi:MAG: nucleoside phosphorylase [Anaerolineae bacterium]|jgi:uridine phosphorylase|nr:nucleoside phosphorylase [Anaerolineae bacterium]
MVKSHHLAIEPGDVGRFVILPGDPGRCKVIASHFDNPKKNAENREYVTYTGSILNEPVSVSSTGIGNPSAAIAIEELRAVGADTFIRVGTSGGMQPNQIPGDLAIITGSIRDEGTSKHYLPIEFPAVANIDVVIALREAAETLGYNTHLGISHSKDSYFGQMAPERMPVANFLEERWKAWVQGGAICAEMESAILLSLGAVYRLRVGSITLIAMNQDKPELGISTDTAPAIKTAIKAIELLIQLDRKNEEERMNATRN